MKNGNHDKLCEAYWELMQRVRADPEYHGLRQQLAELEPKYEAILASLPEEDRLLLDRYITIRESMGRRLAEFCVSEGNGA